MAKPPPQKVFDGFAWITRVALFLLLTIVCARCGLPEMLRDPMPVLPGQVLPARGPGPAAGIALDLLLWIPGLLVLLRRLLDRAYRVRLPWSLLPLALLSMWAMVSTVWASDKFAALVNAFHLIGAGGVMFAAVQLAGGGRAARLVAGVTLGVMLMLLANGVNKRLVETPESVRQWNDRNSPNSRWRYMQEHGLQESDFQFKQMEKKLQGGELTGFSASANTYAAMIAVGLVVMFGVLAQRWSDGRKWSWVIAVVVLPAIMLVRRYTHSLQADITPLIGLAALGLMWWKGAWLAAQAKVVYWLGVGVFVLGSAGLVGHGMHHGSLPGESLTVRWYYWIGAARIMADRPLAGVGWANFGEFYPAVRMARATEEVQDPHNILVRACVELGIVGGTLLMVWLLRMFWEMTRPVGTANATNSGYRLDACATKANASPVPWAIGLGIAAMVVNMLAGHDFAQGPAWLELQAIYSLGTAVLVTLAILVTTGRDWPVTWDDAGTDWMLRGVVVAAGIFFIHNLVDFSWCEPAALCLFALLAGTAIGVRQPATMTARPNWGVVAMCGAAAAVWLAAIVWVWRPVYVAEDRAAEADARLRAVSPGGPGSAVAIAAAAEGYAAAFEMMPLNADYLLREAQVCAWQGERTKAIQACEKAIHVNPREAKYGLFRADLELSGERPDPAIVKRAMESAIALDPRQVFLRIHYGDALLKLGDKPGARREYAKALSLDDELPKKEPKRLAPATRKEIEQKAMGDGSPV